MRVWWGDERYLPRGDPDRNDTQDGEAGLRQLGLDEAKVHRVQGPDESESAEASAAAYAATIREHGHGDFDVVVLGVGPDGHVASLFPHHAALGETARWAVPIDPPPATAVPQVPRVTLTMPALCGAADVLFLAAGAEKSDVIRRVREGDTSLPATVARGRERTVWLVDREAGA